MGIRDHTTYKGYFRVRNKPEDIVTTTDLDEVRKSVIAYTDEGIKNVMKSDNALEDKKFARKDQVEHLLARVEELNQKVADAGLVPQPNLSKGTSLAKTILIKGLGL